MFRLTARLLLLLALLGNFVPAGLAATVSAPKCCLRKTVHHCHSSLTQADDGFSIRSNFCCAHDCCRAATPAQSAHPEARGETISAHRTEPYLSKSQPSGLSAKASTFLSTRAPPQFFIL
jgi:hypothetical protein